MPLTRGFKDTVMALAERNPGFRIGPSAILDFGLVSSARRLNLFRVKILKPERCFCGTTSTQPLDLKTHARTTV